MTNTQTAATRLDWIDYAKGVGIILVVFGHVLKGLNAANITNPVFYYYTINFIYSFHMPLFFLLSGYFFLRSFQKKGNTQFVVNKLESIAYVYVIWSVIQTLIELKLAAYTNNHVEGGLSLSFLYKPADQFWFLFALFFINILSLFIFNVSVKWGILISVVVWVFCLNFRIQHDIFNKVYHNLLYFTAGIALSQYKYITQLILTNKYVLLLNVLIFTASLYVYFSFPQNAWYNKVFPQLSGCCIVLYLCRAFTNVHWLKFLEYLGTSSMVIYLVHILAASGVRIILAKFLHIHNSAIHIILGTLIGIIAPLIMANIAKKTPYLSWLFAFPRWNRKKQILPVNA